MRIIADTTVDLPFKLDFCAVGPNVDPLRCEIGGFAIMLQFPPSLSATTDGLGIFGDWAWWTGMRLRLVMEREAAEDCDIDDIREQAITAGDETLRRFLNTYRCRFDRPDVFPVRIDPRTVELTERFDDGTERALPEPSHAFFYQTMPAEPPLGTSVNSTTIDALARDVRDAVEPEISRQLELDADALEAQGEYLRAELIRGLARQQL